MTIILDLLDWNVLRLPSMFPLMLVNLPLAKDCHQGHPVGRMVLDQCGATRQLLQGSHHLVLVAQSED
jgi:hypothetical protein